MVEDKLREVNARFNLKQVNYDSWQATHMAIRLQACGLGKIVHGHNRKPGLPMVEVPPTGANLQRMATTLIEGFSDRRLELFEDAALRRDLKRLRVE